MTPPVDATSREYIALAFALEQHVEGFVDAYFGPEELRHAASQRAPAQIVGDLAALRRQVRSRDYSSRRKGYLTVQLQAMEATARRVAGETLGYRDEVRACFDIEPQHTPEDVFDEAIAALDALLPGSGPISERMQQWRQGFEVAPAVARQMIDRITDEARRRTQALVRMPDDEQVAFALVDDKPWSGYNWYLGAARSLVEINTDLPIRANGLLDLVCHEAYPGHHTEHALKEQHLYRERGWGEQTIQLINTPECVVSEGIATLAADVLFGVEKVAWANEMIYPLGGISGDPEREQQISAAQWALRAVAGNAALLLHEDGAAEDEVVAYLTRYGLQTEREARQRLRFISTPLWRPYIFTYYAGHELLGRWLERGDKRERFMLLLTEQTYPSLIEGWAIEEERNCVSG